MLCTVYTCLIYSATGLTGSLRCIIMTCCSHVLLDYVVALGVYYPSIYFRSYRLTTILESVE